MFIQRFIRGFVSNEVGKENYFREKLRKADQEPLTEVVDLLARELPNKDIYPTILAVGSSTFPEWHWEERAKLREEKPSLQVSLIYRDIDLRVVPAVLVPALELKDKIAEILTGKGYLVTAHDSTSMGASYPPAYEDGRKTVTSFAHFGYGVYSLRIILRSGTPLDIIIGDEDSTASEKISHERKNNHAFSLLHTAQL